MTDLDLLDHAITAAGDDWHLAKAMGRSYKTIAGWKSKRKLPKGIREHIYLILQYVTPCTCQDSSALAEQPKPYGNISQDAAIGTVRVTETKKVL